MVLKIIKPMYQTNFKVTASPVISRFFSEITTIMLEQTTYKIDTADFLDDSGEVAESLPLLSMDNSYYNVFINGVLQMEDNFAYTSGETGIGSLLVSIPEGSSIEKGSVLILEVINFKPEVVNRNEY